MEPQDLPVTMMCGGEAGACDEGTTAGEGVGVICLSVFTYFHVDICD